MARVSDCVHYIWPARGAKPLLARVSFLPGPLHRLRAFIFIGSQPGCAAFRENRPGATEPEIHILRPHNARRDLDLRAQHLTKVQDETVGTSDVKHALTLEAHAGIAEVQQVASVYRSWPSPAPGPRRRAMPPPAAASDPHVRAVAWSLLWGSGPIVARRRL